MELNPLFLKYAQQRGCDSPQLLLELERQGSLESVPGVPADAKAIFETALEISAKDHLQIQSAFQKHVDNAVSKTINLPDSAGPEVVANAYRRAWELRFKGVTVFRYGSKRQQVLRLGVSESSYAQEHFSKCDPDTCRL